MSRSRDTADQINRVDSSAANATAITIDSSENVLVGKTSNSFGTTGVALNPDGSNNMTRSGDPALALNRLSSDGAILGLYKDGTTVGSIFSGHGGSQVGIGTNTTGITFNPSTRSMMPANPSSTSPQLDATLDIGFSSVRWKDLYLSGGVYLGGTGAANKLDDYEEGTGATAVTGSGGGTATTTSFASYYTRVGRMVQFQFEFRVTSISGCSGRLQFAVPFVSLDYAAGALRCYDVTFDGSPFIQIPSGTAVISFETSKTGTQTQPILSTGYYFGSITYAV